MDDGKSTLIGRLLYEAEAIYEDQLASVRRISEQKNAQLDLSLITDGLKAEREQAITIDVAYRYFSTTKRKFIIADTPGHEQYTRNMVTGASTADLAVLLVDAGKGLLEQTLRHAYIIWMLGIRHVVLAINKMDLVDYDERRLAEIQTAFYASTSLMKDLTRYFVPVSALAGDNIVVRSRRMPWYSGPTLLELLEEVPIGSKRTLEGFRFPVQNVIRPHSGFRGYCGQIASGSAKPGQEVMVLPSGCKTTIDQILLYDKALPEAVASQSVVLTLKNHTDLSRGDMLVDPTEVPAIAARFTAELIWMSDRPLEVNVPYLIKHTTQLLCGSVLRVAHKLDVHDFSQREAQTLQLNEIGRVEIETHKAMFFDPYPASREMGGFIMIDPATSETAAAGLLLERPVALQNERRLTNSHALTNRGSGGLTAWFTGLSGAGKTTLCNAVATELLALGFTVEVLDANVVRRELNSDLGFDRKDRDDNVRRIGFMAQLLSRNGIVVLVAAISPYRAVREELRRSIPNFLEVYVNAPLAVCELRDPKGLYKRARDKQIQGFTGIDDPYQPPLSPDVECMTDRESIKASTDKVIGALLSFCTTGATTPISLDLSDGQSMSSRG